MQREFLFQYKRNTEQKVDIVLQEGKEVVLKERRRMRSLQHTNKLIILAWPQNVSMCCAVMVLVS